MTPGVLLWRDWDGRGMLPPMIDTHHRHEGEVVHVHSPAGQPDRCRPLAAGRAAGRSLRRCLLAASRPPAAQLVAGTLADLARDKPTLIAENALLRQQLIVLRRSVKRPRCTPADRALLVLLASRLPAWRQALLIVQSDTLLRWHRQLVRRYWHRKSRAAAP
ncbi:MAG: hypothetical protein M3N47_11095, partial [Chloroflexota bacterium]|nr:hypothetical protein [Chloroflexota bacterium]